MTLKEFIEILQKIDLPDATVFIHDDMQGWSVSKVEVWGFEDKPEHVRIS